MKIKEKNIIQMTVSVFETMTSMARTVVEDVPFRYGRYESARSGRG